MKLISAEFDRSSERLDQCPISELPEYAFIGRSNVGKSSLINMLTAKKGLAKTSSKPGKTKLINHFNIVDDNEKNNKWVLVDLPGYGYASVSKKERDKWAQFIEDYILKRENLINLFVLIDSRIEPQKIDLEFITWLAEHGVPFTLVMTKIDKLTKNQLASGQAKYRKKLKESWEVLPDIILSSSENTPGVLSGDGVGREELLERIGNINQSISSS